MSDERYMALALALGRRGLGSVWPNPAVGCVIVKDGHIVGRGRTAATGRPHAEAAAMAQAGALAAGATAYVSLEPCAAPGRDESCTDKLLRAGVGRVVVAVQDPNPAVDGKGLARLRDAGIDCRSGVLQAEAEEDHLGFFLRMRAGRPAVTLKLAASLDGRIAMPDGESRWITGAPARRSVHALRAQHDAVMIGAGTARTDDPALDVREMGAVHQPVRIVLSAGLDLPPDGRLARGAASHPTWLLHAADLPADRLVPWQDRGARLFAVPRGPSGGLDPVQALAALGAAGLTRVLCEGGGHLAASLVAAGLVDRIRAFAAGLVLGADARPMLAALPLARLADAPRFLLQGQARIGEDVMTCWRRA